MVWNFVVGQGVAANYAVFEYRVNGHYTVYREGSDWAKTRRLGGLTGGVFWTRLLNRLGYWVYDYHCFEGLSVGAGASSF